MGSSSSGYRSWAARACLSLVVLAALAAVAFAACSEDDQPPAPLDEVEAESPAADQERASPERAEGSGEESGAGESGEPEAAALAPERAEELRSRIEQRVEQTRQRFDEIRRIVEEARAAGEFGNLRGLAERSGAGSDESTRDLCLRSGVPEGICEQVGERGAQGAEREP